jgi:hypothetical protein
MRVGEGDISYSSFLIEFPYHWLAVLDRAVLIHTFVYIDFARWCVYTCHDSLCLIYFLYSSSFYVPVGRK